MSAIMNRTLLRAPRRFPEVARVTPSVYSTAPRYTFLSYGRLRNSTSSSHLSTEHTTPNSSSPSGLPAEENDTIKSHQTSQSTQHIPWYLQEGSSVPAAAEVTSRDQLPELPENPPKILPELLEYVFKDLGLDGLKLIDLRGLETPAALGANVIMIIGTARSVKHLNVSSDRLCRWLRSTHKLSPYADGLLGRNELKIKLRRKTRRARIASRTGAMVDDKDDGITTGWICVNAGVVEKAPANEETDGEFEGFGPRVGGTRVVVQLFTEEKRAELDLESLWEGRIMRAQRERERNSDIAKDASEEVRSINSTNSSPSDYKSSHIPRSTVSPPFEQKRHFHSTIQINSPSPVQFAPSKERQARFQGDRRNSGSLARLSESLSSLSVEEMKAKLGDGPGDRSSTAFLRDFYKEASSSSLEAAAVAELELMCSAASQGYTGYSRESIYQAFMGCCMSAGNISEQAGTLVLDVLLAPRTGDDPGGEWFTDSDKEMALSALDQFILRGEDFMNLQVFTRLYYLASLPPGPGAHRDTSPAERGAHVLRMIDTLSIPFDPVAARTLMFSILRNRDFQGFWTWWRKLPLKGSARTYEDYETLFRIHAELNDRGSARECLLNATPMMSRENPPVPLEGELLKHVHDCLFIAYPKIELRAAEGGKAPFHKLLRECQDKLRG
ncbi:RsfS/YbeB/iojap family protein [Aspergillus puulaauensis]|uniref:ATPase synthesis protein 25 n=1 Tax=Aspergillus puulaauensis TaxID=1220207 RepID=A0A7R7XE94_9EURO|nr:ATPase synthesis protein 25 mitochondrial [Aspergillus puulaauensis]BCS19822.1 ATPase synthesis protein 25 mitochondrial [Aspergillus puulaauensis]